MNFKEFLVEVKKHLRGPEEQPGQRFAQICIVAEELGCELIHIGRVHMKDKEYAKYAEEIHRHVLLVSRALNSERPSVTLIYVVAEEVTGRSLPDDDTYNYAQVLRHLLMDWWIEHPEAKPADIKAILPTVMDSTYAVFNDRKAKQDAIHATTE